MADALEYSVSSATIRNDMAALEQLGYLEQPHTSAGRIPSYRGYRFYIANLMTKEPLSEHDRKTVEDTLLKGDRNPKTLISNATDLLAQITDCAIVSSTNRMDFSVITRVEVIPAGRRLYALLMITSGGAVENRVCRLEFDLTHEQIEFFTEFIRKNLTGLRVEELTSEKVVELGIALGSYMMALAPLLYGVYDISNQLKQQRVEIKNETRLLARPDFQTESVAALMRARGNLESILNRAFDGIHVIFGDESDTFAVSNSSLIVSGYSQAGRPAGSFGIVGPLRLEYGRIIPYVEFLSDTVSQLMTEEYEDERTDR